MGLTREELAAVRLLEWLDARGYDFVTITPESHWRVARRRQPFHAVDLRDIFGWSMPFDEAVAGPELLGLLHEGDLVETAQSGLKATVRVSRVRGQLFIHSAFPTRDTDSVFLGPDTLRFLDFVERAFPARPVRRLVDVGAGAGVGGILAAKMLGLPPKVELADLNRRALSFARVNAHHARVEVETIESDSVSAVPPGFDLVIANPPFIIDDGGPAYRAGGGMHGTELSVRWCREAAEKLGSGGCILLYTGSPIIDGCDRLRDTLRRELANLGCTLEYREIDPDIFGEELDRPAYRQVERIAAVGARILKA